MTRGALQSATAVLMCLQCAGCGNSAEQLSALTRQVAELQSENRKLLESLKASAREQDELREAIGNLRRIGDRRADHLYAVARIEIDRLSGPADYDGRAGDDGLNVYLNLFDGDGHKFKAPGDITVHIYDLAAPDDPEQVAAYTFDAGQARSLWQGRLLTYHYKIKCPWQTRPPRGRKVFVTATFLDYLSGKTHEASREVALSPSVAAP